MTRTADKVPCPDCGRRFLPRGLASHRRQKHPAAPGPDPSARVLERVLAALERIEARLAALMPHTPGGRDAERLRAELERVRAEARVVAAERATLSGEGSEELRRARDRELGRLRRRQARILYELGELDDPPYRDTL